VDAWRLLSNEFPLLHLLLIGPYESHDPLDEGTAQALTSEPAIHLTGARWDTVALYGVMDVFCLPSHREGLPTVLLEAGAMSLPSVATHIPGCVDVVVDGVTGHLTLPRDSAALAAALRQYLLSPRLRRRHGLAARERVLALFDQEAVRQAHYDEYIRLLRKLTKRPIYELPNVGMPEPLASPDL
jgi:glycosyltransferase involved in cell wall biosynthesis